MEDECFRSRSVRHSHLGRRQMLPSQVMFAKALDPGSGEVANILTWRIDLAVPVSTVAARRALEQVVVEDCLLHSVYASDGEFIAECLLDNLDELVEAAEGDATPPSIPTAAGFAVVFRVNGDGASAASVDLFAAHWVCDVIGMKILAARVESALTGGRRNFEPLSRPAYEKVRHQQAMASDANLNLLAGRRSLPMQSQIRTRLECHASCTSGRCFSTQNELSVSLDPETYLGMKEFCATAKLQEATVALASYCKAIAERWDIPIVVVVSLFADRWGPMAHTVSCLVNPRPIWVDATAQSAVRYLEGAQRALVDGLRRGFLESFDPWFENALGDRAAHNGRISFNFTRPGTDSAINEFIAGPKSFGGRSIHQAWMYGSPVTSVSTLAPDCCASRSDLEGLVARQVQLIQEWAS